MSYESLLDAMEGIAFVTAVDGTVTAVGARNWNAFARANGAPEMDASTVLGRNLLDFVSGGDVRQRLAKIMAAASAEPAASVVVPLRCDSPGTRRCLRQTVRPLFSGNVCTGLVFQSIELDAQSRPPIDLFDFREDERLRGGDEALPLVVMCSWCQRVRLPTAVEGDGWVEAEEYCEVGGASSVRLSHGICERCSAEIVMP